MKISEKYRLSNDELCVILEENKEITPKKDKNNPDKVLEPKLEWKPIAYLPNIEFALDYVIKKELIQICNKEADKILSKIEELKLELPQISTKIFKDAKVFKKEEIKLNKTKKRNILDDEIEYHNDFLNDEETE